MAHNLTEVNEFSNDGTLQVPDGTDDHHLLSSYITFIAQTLANRSQNLKAITAKLGDPNTFTEAQIFEALVTFNGGTSFDDQLYVNFDDADRAVLASDSSPANSPVAGNKWKLLLRFRTGTTGAGGQYVNVYAGRDATTYGSFAVVINASWASATQLWTVRDTALAASALIWRYGGVYYTEIAPGTATFADWPRTHTTAIDVTTGSQGTFINGGNGDISSVTASAGVVWIPFRLPHGTVVSGLEIMHDQNTAAGDSFILYEKAPNWASPGATALTSKGSVTAAAATGWLVTPMTVSPALTIDGGKEYMLQWTSLSNSRHIGGLRVVGWTDPGLRNH